MAKKAKEIKWHLYRVYGDEKKAQQAAKQLRRGGVRADITPRTSASYYGEGNYKRETVYDLHTDRKMRAIGGLEFFFKDPYEPVVPRRRTSRTTLPQSIPPRITPKRPPLRR